MRRGRCCAESEWRPLSSSGLARKVVFTTFDPSLCSLRISVISALNISRDNSYAEITEIRRDRREDFKSLQGEAPGACWLPNLPPDHMSMPPGNALGLSSSCSSEMSASVVSISPAIDAAFCSAQRVTLAGSITPAATRSSNFSVTAL